MRIAPQPAPGSADCGLDPEVFHPVGKYRDEGATYLLVIQKNGYEMWKGRSLSPRDTKNLTAEATSTFAQLSMYGLERVYQSPAATPSQSETTTQARSR